MPLTARMDAEANAANESVVIKSQECGLGFRVQSYLVKERVMGLIARRIQNGVDSLAGAIAKHDLLVLSESLQAARLELQLSCM